MSEPRVDMHNFDQEQCRQMLTKLPGIFAAGLRFSQEQLVEIHVLASTERTPKQITRDVESALFAAYGWEVDHRIISVAQLPEDPFKHVPAQSGDGENTGRDREVRLLFKDFDFQLKDNAYRARVHLSYNGKIYTGEFQGRDTQIQRMRTVAQATIEAAHNFLGCDPFNLLEVKQVDVLGVMIDVALIEFIEGNSDPLTLVGAVVQPDNAEAGIVRATLDGLNRNIGKLSLGK